MQVQIGPEIVRSYKRLSYTLWHALAEFVDNSIQSYFNNRLALDYAYSASGQKLTVEINYGRAGGGHLTIRDNAMGMSEEELREALRIGRPPDDTSGLSEFGMGLKTAASWFGNRWAVQTKKLHYNTVQAITFDVERVALYDFDLGHQQIPSAEGEHFTEINITDLNHQLYGQTIGSVKTYLRSMYRWYLQNEHLVLTFNGDRLTWESPIKGNLHIDDGQDCYDEFDFYISQKRVHGWLAILERGSRADVGMTIIRRGRVIRGWPNSWRPQSIFGQLEGSNDLVNQRLVGEIHLDDFKVSHTKDDILWEDDDQELLEVELARVAERYIEIASSYRKRGTRGSRPSRSTITFALGMLDEEIRSQRFLSVITANGSASQGSYETFSNSTVRAVATAQPRATYHLDGLTLNVFLLDHLSERDPYLGVEIGSGDTLTVVINMNHPHISDLNGRMGVLNHLRACTYEGVAQWKVNRAWGEDSPSLIRAIKDSLLRVGRSVDDQSSIDGP